MSTGIEINFDEKRGHLELACEPEAFAQYRDVIRQQLADFPEIPIDKVIELNVTDTATFVARRDAPRKRLFDAAVVILIVAILALAGFGAIALVSKVMG